MHLSPTKRNIPEETFRDRAAVDRFVATTSEQLGATTDARDWVDRTWALVDHNIAAAAPFNSDLRVAARSIRARLLLIPNCFDQLHTPGAGGVMEVAANAPNAKIAAIDDILGHSGNSSPRGVTVITAEVRDLLQRIADGRPGFSGPHFPRQWTRQDRCPVNRAGPTASTNEAVEQMIVAGGHPGSEEQ